MNRLLSAKPFQEGLKRESNRILEGLEPYEYVKQVLGPESPAKPKEATALEKVFDSATLPSALLEMQRRQESGKEVLQNLEESELPASKKVRFDLKKAPRLQKSCPQLKNSINVVGVPKSTTRKQIDKKHS